MRQVLLGLLVAGGLVLAARPFTGSAGADAPEPPPGTRLATLFRYDPLRSVMSIRSGDNGRVVRDGSVWDQSCDLDYGNVAEGALTVALEEGRAGAIVDLGTPAELARRYGFEETLGGGQGYASIHREGAAWKVRRGAAAWQTLSEGRLLDATVRGASAPVVLGHVYLVRVVDAHDKGYDRVAKVMVVGHLAGQSVTLRWAPL